MTRVQTCALPICQKDCEDLLVQIVSERRVADDQRKQVEADSERIGLEASECKAISDDAEADLAIAMPALEKAMEEVEKLDKGAISEVKAYTKPPALVETVLQVQIRNKKIRNNGFLDNSIFKIFRCCYHAE